MWFFTIFSMFDGFHQAKEDLFIQTRRVKREADRTETETIYIGLIFDGFVKYQNLSKSINTESYGILTIVEPPRFATDDANRVFVFRRGQLLDIKVIKRLPIFLG